MTGKRKGKGGHHRSYRGPWPEDHGTQFSGRRPQGDKDTARTKPEGGSAQPKVHKIPQNAPK